MPLTKEHYQERCFYEDTKDGSLYRKWEKSITNLDQKIVRNYTFIINTDGIQVAEKSKLSLWPVYLALNELPIGERYCLDKIIIAGFL